MGFCPVQLYALLLLYILNLVRYSEEWCSFSTVFKDSTKEVLSSMIFGQVQGMQSHVRLNHLEVRKQLYLVTLKVSGTQLDVL